MRKLAFFVLVCAGLAVAPAAHAQSFSEFAVGLRVGSLGPGLEATTALAPKFNLRLGIHYLPYDRSDDITSLEIDVRSDASVKLASGALLADFFPARRGFRLTGGLVLNQNKVDVLVTPLENYTIEEKSFSPDRIGTISAKLGHKLAVNPYLGLGFGNPVHEGAAFGFAFDLGFLYTDSPTVEMVGTGMITPTADQAPQIEEDLSGIKLYPVISFGLNYKL